jgi:pyruvate oxidase
MNPLTNAIIGILFLSAGTLATVVMYSLRGRSSPNSRSANAVLPPTRNRAAARPTKAAPPHRPAKVGRATRDPVTTASGGAHKPQKPAETDDNGSSTRTQWHKVAEPMALADGSVQALQAGTQSVAVTRQGDQYGAVAAHCPHQGGPLAEGTFEDGLLRCPWHGWGFHAVTGESVNAHHGNVPAYPIEARDEGVFIAIEEPVSETRTVSDVMVETMVNWGVRHVFGMVGHSNLGLAEAVRKQEQLGNLTFYGIRHEGTAAFACSAYAKLTGKPAACLTIAGPGATNLLTGLWDAHVDRSPVLALTGQVNTQVLGPGAFQEIDQASAFQAVAAWSQTVLTTSDHVELMSLALKHALIQRGVSHLIFPDEVQVLPAADEEAASPEGRLSEDEISPSSSSVEQAVEMIASASRPVIIVGYGARDSMQHIVDLATRLNAPILTTFKAKGQIPDRHPLAGGVLGRSGTPIAGGLMSQSDLLLVFGASFAAHTGIDRSKPIIQVDFDRLALAKFHPVALPVWGEISRTIEWVLDRLPNSLSAYDARQEIAQRWSDWRAEKDKRASQDQGHGINSAAIFAALTRQVPDDAVVPVDVGNNTYSFGRYFECSHQTVLMSGYLGSIGFALPAALGARAAVSDRPVVSISGDGGFGQYMGEFTTAVKYGMDITHVLLNNEELGKISKEQRAGHWPVWQTALSNPSFAEYARLCGGFGVRVSKIEDLDSAIADGIAHRGPALIEIISDAELV